MCKKKSYCNRKIDECIVEEIIEIKKKSSIKKTVSSCCGHGKYPKTIVVESNEGIIIELFSGILLGKRKRNRYYKKDKDGFYFIPEVIWPLNPLIGRCLMTQNNKLEIEKWRE